MADVPLPGQAVDGVLSSVTRAAKGIISSVSGAIQGAGEGVQSAVDMPFRRFGLRASPLRIIDRPLKAVVRATEDVVNDGAIGTIETVGKGIADGVDEVPKTLLGSGMGEFKPPRFPWFGRR